MATNSSAVDLPFVGADVTPAGADSVTSPQPLTITRLVVKADRIACTLQVSPTAPASTSPALIRRLLSAHPHLLDHACVNDEGDTFAAVADHTSLPHLVEHLVIDLQVQGAVAEPLRGTDSVQGIKSADEGLGRCRPRPRKNTMYVGTTEWADRFRGQAVIEVSYTDDLACLRAFRDAVDAVNALLGRPTDRDQTLN